jgi:hypothetical protein
MPSAKQVNRNILYRVTPANQSTDWVILWQAMLGINGDWSATSEYSGFMHSLSLLGKLKGLEEKPLPPNIFEPELNQAERFLMARDYQATSPRIHLDLALRNQPSGEWCEVATIALLPTAPYFKIDLLEHITPRVDFLLERNCQLGFKLVDVGFGLLQPDSFLSFTGGVQEQQYYSGESKNFVDTWVNSSANLTANTSALVVEANPRRKYLSIINNGNEMAFLSLGSPAVLDEGISINPKGGSYSLEWQRGSYSQQAIYAVSKKATKLAITEGSVQ